MVSDGSKKQAFDHLSLERALPQTPPAASDWTKWFLDEDERESWTHRLANLVPLHIRKNPAASNYDFATKNVYFKGKGTASPFILTQSSMRLIHQQVHKATLMKPITQDQSNLKWVAGFIWNIADDRVAAARYGAGVDQASRTRTEKISRYPQGSCTGWRTAYGCGAGFLQHFRFHSRKTDGA